MNIENLGTEKRNITTENIDQLSIKEILEVMNQEDRKVPIAIEPALPMIENIIKKVIDAFNQGGRLIYMGAGTSGRLGILDAVECVPTFGVSEEQVIGLIAGGSGAITKAVEGAEDSEAFGEEDLRNIHLSDKDVVIGIAASGRTPYVIGGLKYANEIGATTATISCNINSEISKYSSYAIEVNSGPEVLTGSTRLKAGTAQKLILNMISTTSMIGIGKVYQNLMVDVQPTNLKLVERSIRIIMEATQVDYHTAAKYFELSNKHVKTAIIMILTESNYEQAQLLLEKNRGFVRKALNYIEEDCNE